MEFEEFEENMEKAINSSATHKKGSRLLYNETYDEIHPRPPLP
jgi:hypothetical protein